MKSGNPSVSLINRHHARAVCGIAQRLVAPIDGPNTCFDILNG
jgi:hypothetical protein